MSSVLLTARSSPTRGPPRELAGSSFGPIARDPLDLGREKVSRHVAPGDEFRYVFDLGDDWTHCCTVAESKVDPLEMFGTAPKVPTPYRGWGTIPDQYGRRWDDDPGEGPLPARPAGSHPMLFGAWPVAGPGEPVDLQALRSATARGDADGILAAIQGRDVDELLLQVGAAAQVVLATDRARGESLALSLLNRLNERAAPGDEILAEDLLAQLRGDALAGRAVAVDLSELASALEGDPLEPGGYLDLTTGEVVPAVLTDPAEVGEDAYVDVEQDPERWLWLERLGSRDGWEDMAAFTAGERDSRVRGRLESAIQGRGAFRRFRDVLHEEGMVERWHGYADDRQIGRARLYLAGHGVRVKPPAP